MARIIPLADDSSVPANRTLPAPVVVSGGGGGGADPEFELLQNLHGATLDDPTPILGGSTGFDSGTGTFTLEFIGDTTLLDGFRETPGWSIPLADLLPDYDPALDILEVLIEDVSWPLGGTSSERGFGTALINQATASGSNGVGFLWYDNTTTASTRKQVRLQTTTLATTTDHAPETSDAILGTFMFNEEVGSSSGNPIVTASHRDTGVWNDDARSAGTNMGGVDPTNWHLRVLAYQGNSAPASSFTYQFKVSTRVIRRGALPV